MGNQDVDNLRLLVRLSTLEQEVTNLEWLMVVFAAIQVITIVAVLT